MAKNCSKYFYGGQKVAYVPYAQNWLAANCKSVKMEDARPGDIVIFTWDGNGYNKGQGSRDHIGIIRKKGTANTAYTIEGNTGGVVANRTRSVKWVRNIYRLGYNKKTGEAVVKTLTNHLGEDGTIFWKAYGAAKGTAWCCITVWYTLANTTPVAVEKHTVPTGSPILKKGSKGKKVKQLEDCLNFVGKYSIAEDGEFGKETEEALKKYQTKEKIKADGLYGPVTASHLKADVKALE